MAHQPWRGWRCKKSLAAGTLVTRMAALKLPRIPGEEHEMNWVAAAKGGVERLGEQARAQAVSVVEELVPAAD